MFVVFMHCQEIRFALDFGVKLRQVVKPPEGDLFSHILSTNSETMLSVRESGSCSNVGGAKRPDILDHICRGIDVILRPGIGVNSFVSTSRPRMT